MSRVLYPLAATLALASPSRADESSSQEPAQETRRIDLSQGKVDPAQLYDLGKALFDAYAPEEVKQKYDFPTREQWESFFPRLQKALQGDSLEALASLEQEALQAEVFLAQFGGTEDLADWLHERIDLIQAARDLAKSEVWNKLRRRPRRPAPPAETEEAKPAVDRNSFPEIPAFDYWFDKISATPTPKAAEALIPKLTQWFHEEDSPRELAWLAEVESSFNPSARSPAGALGLYQLMPATAKSLGLNTMFPDERKHPEKSSRAAARMLNRLHEKFGDWALALAAYNGGEGRVRRLLAKSRNKDFADIADKLPVETRLYVPKVLATIATRTQVPLR